MTGNFLLSHILTLRFFLQTGDLGALDEFEALFKGAQFHKGLEMSFTNTKDGSLALRIGSKEVGWLSTPASGRFTQCNPCRREPVQACAEKRQVERLTVLVNGAAGRESELASLHQGIL
jgi:hypothetical protein